MNNRDSLTGLLNFVKSNWIQAALIILLVIALASVATAGEMPAAGKSRLQAYGPLSMNGLLRSSAADAGKSGGFTPFFKKSRANPSAKTETWNSYPIYGGEMTAIAMDPSNPGTVYVGTRAAGVFKTIDGGLSWQPARTGLTVYPVRSLRVDPQHPNTLYAGTDFQGIWRSDDGGNTWFKASSGLDDSLVVMNILIDPKNTNIIYAGLAGGVAMCVGDIYKSTNGGVSWEKKDNGIPRYENSTFTSGIFSMALDPDNPLLVYAGTETRGAFKSMDGGESWIDISSGIPFMSGDAKYLDTVNALSVDPLHSNRLSSIIVGLDEGYYIFENGVWRKVNGTSSLFPSFFPQYLYFHPTDPSIIYSAGGDFAKSINGGGDWTAYMPDVADIAFDRLSPDTIYAASRSGIDYDGGVYKTADQGQTWVPSSQGITANLIKSVIIDPRNSANIYAASADGFFYGTQDGGHNWSMGYQNTQEKDYRFCQDPGAIAVDPLDSLTVYAAGAFGLFRSTDQGKTFSIIDSVPFPRTVAFTPNASSPIYAGGDYGIYKSSDGGSTWEQKNQGLQIVFVDRYFVTTIAVDPNHPNTLWAGTQGGGIAKTTDGGEHWNAKGIGNEMYVNAIAVRPDNSSEILAFANGNIYKSTNGGDNWQVKLSGIPSVTSIVYDPDLPTLVYAATEGGGVMRSKDGGETWHDFSDGLFYPVVYSLAISRDKTPRLVAGTYGSGLYWIDPQTNPAEVSITSLSPASGETGTLVTVVGTNFGSSRGSSVVKFNGVPATAYASWANTQIKCKVPGNALTGPVTVTTPKGTSNGITFTVTTVPFSITSISPAAAPVGGIVTISGTNFGKSRGASVVRFNGVPALRYNSWSSNRIKCKVPSGASTGPVTVSKTAGASNEVAFGVIPNITSINPKSGPVGTFITITGSGFGSTQGSSAAKFNGVSAVQYASWSDTRIVCSVPSEASTGPVTVTTEGGSSKGLKFKVIPPPSVASVSPASGPIGTVVTIIGANFGSFRAGGAVQFNGVPAVKFTSWSSTRIRCKVPSGASSGPVTVVTSRGASNGYPYTVTP